MSAENMEAARRLVDAFNAGDVEAVVAVTHPDVEFIPRRAPVQGEFNGHDGIRAFFADNAESFDVFHVEQKEMLEHGDLVIGIGSLRVRGKGSGAEAVVPTAVVLTFRDAKIARFEDFGERSRALTAAGLPDHE